MRGRHLLAIPTALLAIPAALVAIPAALSAQEARPREAPPLPESPPFEVRVYQPAQPGEQPGGEAPPARLGLYLVDWCFGAPTRATVACDRPPVVRVLVGGPAERAGVRPGDTLIAVDGEPITTRGGQRALASLQPGVPVELRISRSGERRTLEVTPEVLAEGGHIVRIAAPGASAWGGPPREVRAVRIPEFSVQMTYGGPPDPAPSAEAPSPHPLREAGPLRVKSGRIIEFGPWVPAPEAERIYVWSDPGLAVRLEAVRESVTVRARVRLDSLLRFHRDHPDFPRLRMDSLQAMAERMARQVTPAQQARAAAAESYDERSPGQFVWRAAGAEAMHMGDLFATRNRVAGAEFEPLSPELGEYFGDLDSGLLVVRVLHGTPAARLGLRPGDVITEAGGAEVEGIPDLRRAFLIRESGAMRDSGGASADRGRGSGLEIRWVRKGEAMSGTLEM